MSNTKSIFVSKTFYLNLALAAVAVVQSVTGVSIAPGEVELIVAAVLNIAVRFMTTQPVAIVAP